MLQVPGDLAQSATPIWHTSTSGVAQFVLARKEFNVAQKQLKSAVAFVTAQQSPFFQPDPRLDGNDYGSCIPSGGTSQAKLLGAYKLFINGKVVGTGPGRRVNETQGVDPVDVTSVVFEGGNAVGLQGYHSTRFTRDEPRLLVQLVLSYVDGTTDTVATGTDWNTMDADRIFNPIGSSGAWAGHDGFPHESLDLRVHPSGWASTNFTLGPGWLPAAAAAPFVLQLANKPARPIAVFERRAAKVTVIEGDIPWVTYPNYNNIYGKLPVPKVNTATVKYLGTFDSETQCWAACNASTVSCIDWTWHHTDFDSKAIAGDCYFTVGGEWSPTAQTKVTSARGPRNSSVPGKIRYLVDFGTELQGGVNLSFVNGKAGQKVVIRLAEALHPDGTVIVPMPTGNNFTDEWTLRDGAQTSIMQHEYMEFRYADLTTDADAEPRTTDNTRAWVIRYPLSDKAEDTYGDEPMLQPSILHPPSALATFACENQDLNSVWHLVRYTLVATSLDVNVDSNTRQRDFCATDAYAYITGLGQLALSSDYGVQTMAAIDGLQVDSNIWQGMTDFRAALVVLVHEHALYTGDLSLIRQRWEDLQKHSFTYYFNEEAGLVVKPPAMMGSAGVCVCPESWSPAGLPKGIYEELKCNCDDLIDWPAQYRDGYVSAGNNASAVANAYIALAAERMADMATWLGPPHLAEAAEYRRIGSTILATVRDKMFDDITGLFQDGLQVQHSSIQATLFPATAGVVDDTAVPGMTKAVLKGLQSKNGTESCSCMAAFWLLEGLYQMGASSVSDGEAAADYALAVMTHDGPHSWLNMLAQGATATMETWPAGSAPHSGGTGGTWSHPWCAGPNSVLIRRLVGVRPIGLGWSRFLLAPQPSSLKLINSTVPISIDGVVSQIGVTLSQSSSALTAVS
jgi:hypothetical protein